MEFNFFLSSNKNNSVETSGLLASNENKGVETVGSVASLLSTGSQDGTCVDAFGGKDIFGNVDFTNVPSDFVASNSNVETAGSLACADFSALGSADFSSSSTGTEGSCGASGSVGGDCGSSSGGFSLSC